MEELTGIITREMSRYSSKSAYLNNFYINLPDDSYKHGGYYRDLAARRIDKSPLEDGADLVEEMRLGYSELYLRQKAKDFFDAIDKALAEERISFDEVKRLQKLGKKDFDKIKELHELVFPAYVRLRGRGYSHKDLAG